MKNFISIFVVLCNFTLFILEATIHSAQSQSIQIDGTTPTIINPSIPGNCPGTCISGGQRQGNNLFHSFDEFSVNSGSTVLFLDPSVQNIFSRVTGTNTSNILGTLGVIGGDANLFLLNPNGILFGENSNLSLNGSFIATTANAVQFGDQGFFSTSISEIPSITINPSALFFQTARGSIANSSSFNEGEGLSVPAGNSLHLIGGDVILDNGGLNSFGGRIELGGLATSGIINILSDKEGFALRFSEKSLKANVLLTGAIIDVTGEGGGNLIINANDIEIKGSKLRAGIGIDLGSSITQAGNIEFNAENSITISDASNISNRPLFNAKGLGGDVIINSNNLYLTENSQVGSNTFGDGNAGNVNLKIEEEVSLDSGLILSSVATFGDFRATGNSGEIIIKTNKLSLNKESEISANVFGDGNAKGITINANEINLNNFSGILSNVETGGVGNGGEIKISTDTLTLRNGSQIASSVLEAIDDIPGGVGKGGDIYVESFDTIDISGFSETNGFSSGILALTEKGAVGPAGNITINTDTFRISKGGIVNAETFNTGNGGSIKISSTNFEAKDGGQITTATFGEGNGGSIKLNVTENITLAGKDINFDRRLDLKQNPLLEDGIEPELPEAQMNQLSEVGPHSGLFASVASGASGKAGNISVDPRLVLIQDGASISVDNAGSNSGGSIFLQAGNLTLDSGTITATSNSNTGGDISLSIADTLLLRDNSQISTTASGKGTGGKININTDFIIAAPTENSDITANASDGKGGQITINTKGIVGLEVREQNTNFSDITAISQNNPQLNGTVNINTPETDPSDNLSEQPETVEPPQDIAQGCRPGQALGGSTFVNIGRGGLPQGPQEAQTPPSLWQDLRAHNLLPSTTAPTPTSLAPPPEILEAKGWAKDTQGRIYLTASAPQPSPNPLQPTPTC